jgi:hypothetical protein
MMNGKTKTQQGEQTMKGITQKQLMEALVKVNGCGIAGIETETEVKLLGGKKNPMLGRVTKVMKGGNVLLFSNSNSNGYNNMVRRRLEKEGKNPEGFKLGKRVWGERVPETPMVLHKGELYMEAIFNQAPTQVQYLLDGEPIAKEDIIGLKEKPEEGKQGGLSDKVVIRTYKLSSIRKLKAGANSVG